MQRSPGRVVEELCTAVHLDGIVVGKNQIDQNWDTEVVVGGQYLALHKIYVLQGTKPNTEPCLLQSINQKLKRWDICCLNNISTLPYL